MAKNLIKIGWIPNDGAISPMQFLPEPLSKIFATDGSSPIHRCPAVLDANKQFFAIRAPVDIEIMVQKNDGVVTLSGIPNTVGKTGFKDYTDMFVLSTTASGRYIDKPLMQFKMAMSFLSDTPDVYMTLLPPFLHPTKGTENVRYIPGRFNIYDWPARHINLALEWLKIGVPLIIKRGEPILYVQFQHTDPEARFAIIECDRTEAIQRMELNSEVANKVIRGTRMMMKLFGKRRPKKLMVPTREE